MFPLVKSKIISKMTKFEPKRQPRTWIRSVSNKPTNFRLKFCRQTHFRVKYYDRLDHFSSAHAQLFKNEP